ncbi:unnamed protein product [Pleuronectes platessa]|uniref:Uncharacterized protein n=1 Tax=Pleuronectes platessa TaxID=8262 RepID=A0A9N7UGS4_PLEPL|nr:unnamed protein product [Pleuronectes platessa]
MFHPKKGTEINSRKQRQAGANKALRFAELHTHGIHSICLPTHLEGPPPNVTFQFFHSSVQLMHKGLGRQLPQLFHETSEFYSMFAKGILINVLQPRGVGGGRLTLATASTHRRPQGAHLPLTSCLTDLSLRDRGREKEREKKKVLPPCDLSPDPGQRPRSSPPYHIMALLCGAVVLCYSSSLVTVLHP